MLFLYILIALYTYLSVSSSETVEVLLWSGGTWAGFGSGGTWSAPNYLGQTVTKPPCQVECRYTGNKGRTGQADAIIFEAQPLASYGDEYLRKPISFPQRRPGQYFINFGYEQQFYFPLYAEPGFLALQDINMTYDQQGAVPITFTCSWGGGSIEDFLKPHPKKSKGIAFMASNCGGGGASFRTIYLKELMKHIQVDSLGGCMRNTKLPADMSKPVYEDHGTSQRWKIEIFKDYKYVLTFENNNVTDYVTEKLPAAFLAGALPIYMGAPNIDSWLPGKKSVIKTDDFRSPKELADYIKHLNDNDSEYEEYFEWKKEGLSDNFKDKYEKCVFYNSECRLCEKIAEMKKAKAVQNAQLNQALPENTKYGEPPELLSRGYAMSLNGNAYVEVPHDERLSEISEEFTLAAWIRIGKAQSMRIIDKSTSETSGGFSLDVQFIGSSHFVRLCAGFRCVVGTRPVSMDAWYYVTAVFSQGQTGVQLYLNGFLDVTAPMFATSSSSSSSHNQSTPLRFGSPAVGSSDIFVGKLDDVSIWKIALDEITIRRNAFARMTGNENGLIGYWSFNEGSGTTVSDWSVNARHGTIQGTASWEDADLKPLTLNPCW